MVNQTYRNLFIILTALVCLYFTVIGQTFVAFNQYNDSDSSYFVYGAKFILEGGTLYQEFWDQKPPGIFWTNAFLISVFGINFSAYAVFAGLLFILWLGYSITTLKGIFKPSVLCLYLITLSFFFHLSHYIDFGNRPEFYLAILEGFAILCSIKYLKNDKNHFLFLSGLLSAAAFFFKPVGMAAFLATGAWLLYTKHRNSFKPLLILGAGFSCTISIVSLILLSQGTLYECIQATLLVPMTLSASHNSIFDAFCLLLKNYGPMWGLGILFFASPYFFLRKTSFEKGILTLLVLHMFASISGIIIQRNSEPHYYLQGVGPILLLAFACFNHLQNLIPVKKHRIIVVIIFAASILFFARYPAIQQSHRYHQLHSIEEKSKEVLLVCNWLNENLQDDQTFYYFSNGYQPYIWTDFKPPHRYSSYFLRHGDKGAELFHQDLERFKENEKLFVIVEHRRILEVLSSKENLNSSKKEAAFASYHQWLQKEFKMIQSPSSQHNLYIRKSKKLN